MGIAAPLVGHMLQHCPALFSYPAAERAAPLLEALMGAAMGLGPNEVRVCLPALRCGMTAAAAAACLPGCRLGGDCLSSCSCVHAWRLWWAVRVARLQACSPAA